MVPNGLTRIAKRLTIAGLQALTTEIASGDDALELNEEEQEE